jgi:hypothetical protein
MLGKLVVARGAGAGAGGVGGGGGGDSATPSKPEGVAGARGMRHVAALSLSLSL